MIKLFGYGLDEQQFERLEGVKGWIVRSLPLECQSVEIEDLRSFDPEADNKDVIILFGKKAIQKASKLTPRFKLELSEVYKLEPSFNGSEQYRQETFDKINKLLQQLRSGLNNDLPKTEPVQQTDKTLNLTEELPKELTTGVTKILEKQQIEQGVTHWQGSTVDGRTIRVTVEPEKDTADINITFAELHAVMGLKEAFRVKELEFVYKPSNSTREDSTK